MVGDQDDIGGGFQAQFLQRHEQAGEVGVGVADRGEGGWPVDAGDQSHWRVALIMLGAVGVA